MTYRILICHLPDIQKVMALKQLGKASADMASKKEEVNEEEQDHRIMVAKKLKDQKY